MFFVKYLLLMFLVIRESEMSCVTPWGEAGECVYVKNCPEILAILGQKPLPPMNEKIVQRALCGIDGIHFKVCCETKQSLDFPERSVIPDMRNKNDYVDECTAPSGRRGNCVNIKKCDKMMSILRQQPLTETSRETLRSSHCGFEDRFPKVCCEIEERIPAETISDNCLTPWGEMGRCININDCRSMRIFLKQTPLPPMHEKLLENARCGLDGSHPKVCCKVDEEEEEEEAKIIEVIRTTPPSRTQLGVGQKHPHSRLLPSDVCGPIPESRIVGGNDTTVYEFPWMALLGYTVGRSIEFRCGGALINEKYVLTAAHCITALPTNMKLAKVRIGEYDLETERDCDDEENCVDKYQEFTIESTRVHDKYFRRSYENDIGLVRLRGSADFRPENVRPVCLPLDPDTTAAISKMPARGVVTGWGATESGPESRTLRKVTLPIVDVDLCKKTFTNNRFIKISHAQICAGGVKDMDSCSGDSGGPLQAIGMYGKRPSYILYGIVSFGLQSCGVKGAPGMYTKVSYYIRWILDNITD